MSAPVIVAFETDGLVAALTVVAKEAHADVRVTAVTVAEAVELLAVTDGTQPAKFVDRARMTHWHAALLRDAVARGAADDALDPHWVGAVVAGSIVLLATP